MPLSDDLPASSPSRLPEDSLAYYKSQYEQLEAELADFQASSKELEAELEKDVEASEKRERQLREKVEGLGYEVEEWKVRRIRAIQLKMLMHSYAIDQIQASKGGGQHGAECLAKGDHQSSGH